MTSAKFHYNVGGVSGLHVACDFFPETVEKRLFNERSLFSAVVADDKKRHQGNFRSLPPMDVVGICNAGAFMQPSYSPGPSTSQPPTHKSER